MIVAAGVLAYGIHDLQEGGVLPGVNNLVFDFSQQIPPASWYGTLLKGTVNFTPATTWLQAVAWLLYVIPVLTMFVVLVRQPSGPERPHGAAVDRPTTRRYVMTRRPAVALVVCAGLSARRHGVYRQERRRIG